MDGVEGEGDDLIARAFEVEEMPAGDGLAVLGVSLAAELALAGGAGDHPPSVGRGAIELAGIGGGDRRFTRLSGRTRNRARAGPPHPNRRRNQR